MKSNKIQNMAYIALYIALYIVLKFVGNFIPFLNMPNGGSIQIELIALFIASYQLGWKQGAFIGVLARMIAIVLGMRMYVVHPMQILLDYVLPLMACGVASLFWPFKEDNKVFKYLFGIALGLATYFGLYLAVGENTKIIGIVLGVIVCATAIVFLKEKESFGVVVAMIISYICTVLSGVYFWADGVAAGSAPAWIFSLQYNLGYTLVTMIVCAIATPTIVQALKKAGVKFEIE